jgi:predicted HAD superfamily Cof-like phosphohydrolase
MILTPFNEFLLFSSGFLCLAGLLLLWSSLRDLAYIWQYPHSDEHPTPDTNCAEWVDWFWDVKEFHEKFGCPVAPLPAMPDKVMVDFRKRLNEEEDEELYAAIQSEDLAGVADALADGIYVRLGMSLAFGIDLRPVWAAIHEANMRKVGGAKRADGKILKPVGWTHPDIGALLAKQESLVSNHAEVAESIALSKCFSPSAD